MSIKDDYERCKFYPQEIFNLFLKEDPKDDISYPFLFNCENSYKTFLKVLNNLFNRRIFITSTEPNKKIFLVFYDLKLIPPDISYTQAIFNSSSYDIIAEYKIKLEEEVINDDNSVSINNINILKKSELYRTKIPYYVAYKGKSLLGNNNLINGFTYGGFFIQNKGMKKYLNSRKDLKNVNPKVKDDHITFNSITPRFTKEDIEQYISVQLSINPFKFDLISVNTINSNIILLILFYTDYSFEQVKNIILNNMDSVLREQAEIIFIKTQELYATFNNNIGNYLGYKVEELIKVNNREMIMNKLLELLSNFLPHLTSRFEKGMYLISIVKQYLIIHFQRSVYPNRDHMIGKRVSSIGCIFEETILNSINSIAVELRKTLVVKNISESFNKLKLENRLYNMFSNVINMKDNTTKKIVKPSINIYAHADIYIPNLVTHGGHVVLTKNLSSRNNELSTTCFEDNVDTPDNSENVGLVKRISVATRITYYTFEEQKQIQQTLIRIINECTKDNNNLNTKNIICSIVDMSEMPITFVNEEECQLIIETIKKYKRYNYENLRFVGIEHIPQYSYNNSLHTYLPNGKTFQLNINYSCKRYYKPFFVVTNGIPEINKIKDYSTLQKFKYFSDFVEEYPMCIEYLDPAQVTYSNVCVDYPTFVKLSPEDQKKYEYINFPSSSNFGIVAASVFDFGRMAGARATFAVAQQKQVLSQATPDVYNKNENGNMLLDPFERPCVSNSILELSGISQFGKGHHVNVAFISYKDNIEDALIFRKRSVERGLLDAVTLTAFRNIVTNIQLNVPTPNKTNNNYSKLGDNGIPRINTILTKDDAICKKIKTIYRKNKEGDKDYANDASEAFNQYQPGRVERTEKSGSDNLNINILISSYKPLKLGDKIVNQGAQKSTVGIFLEDHELPHTSDGCIPDIIFNSTSILSRNTLALYIQIILTNVFGNFPLLEDGKTLDIQDYPTFTNLDINELLEILRKRYSMMYPLLNKEEIENKLMCNVDMYDSYGKRYKDKVLFASLMYERSNQMSIDKISVRNGGRLSKTGIPVSGRRRNGGQKNGEMETDILITHGVSNIIYEHSCDVNMIKSYSYWCDRCSTAATKEIINGKIRWYCIPCEENGLITKIIKHNYTQAYRFFKELSRCRGIDIKLEQITEEPHYSFQSIN